MSYAACAISKYALCIVFYAPCEVYMIVLLYFCCFVLKYQSVKELLRAHVCHVDLYILLLTLNKIYLLTYLLWPTKICLNGK